MTFPVMAKVDCSRGATAHPLFRFLTDSVVTADWKTTLFGNGVKWNFSKFLCDRNGIPVQRYEPGVPPLDIESAIVDLISEP